MDRRQVNTQRIAGISAARYRLLVDDILRRIRYLLLETRRQL
jgi:hypothetical protein